LWRRLILQTADACAARRLHTELRQAFQRVLIGRIDLKNFHQAEDTLFIVARNA